MKICFISHSSAKGGAERALLELIDALRAQGVEAYVLLPSCGPLIEELKSRQIVYQVFPYKWWMGKDSPIWKRIGRAVLNLAIAIAVALRIKQYKCDLVYTNTITVCVGALAAKLLGLPHVWHIHEFGYEDHRLVFDLGQRLSLWLMDRFSTICVANSHAVAKKYQQHIRPSKLKVVYQAVSVPQNIPVEKTTSTSNAKIRCVIVGGLQEGKRQEDAILAIGELVQEGVKAKLYVVGDGDPTYKEYLHNLVKKNGLYGYVEFIGYTEDPFSFMQSADVVLMCSRCEAFGRVTVEAMKLAKPVIGTRSGGTTELIRDGLNGLLYSPGDYKELAEKIRYLHEHPAVARRMGENGRQWAQAVFKQERYGKEILTILEQFAGSKKLSEEKRAKQGGER